MGNGVVRRPTANAPVCGSPITRPCPGRNGSQCRHLQCSAALGERRCLPMGGGDARAAPMRSGARSSSTGRRTSTPRTRTRTRVAGGCTRLYFNEPGGKVEPASLSSSSTSSARPSLWSSGLLRTASPPSATAGTRRARPTSSSGSSRSSRRPSTRSSASESSTSDGSASLTAARPSTGSRASSSRSATARSARAPGPRPQNAPRVPDARSAKKNGLFSYHNFAQSGRIRTNGKSFSRSYAGSSG